MPIEASFWLVRQNRPSIRFVHQPRMIWELLITIFFTGTLWLSWLFIYIFLFAVTQLLLEPKEEFFAPKEEKCEQHKAKTNSNCDYLGVYQIIFSLFIFSLGPHPIVDLIFSWLREQKKDFVGIHEVHINTFIAERNLIGFFYSTCFIEPVLWFVI